LSGEANSPGQWIGLALFAACWLIALISWGYGFVERRWLRLGDPRAFRFGPKVLQLTDTTLARHHVSAPEHPVEIPGGLLVPLEGGRLGFAPRVGSLFHPLSGFRDFAFFKGVISWQSGVAEAQIRAPAGLSTFLLAVGTAWIVFGVFHGSSSECTINGVSHPPDSIECMSVHAIFPILLAGIALIVWTGIRARARAVFSAAVSYLTSEGGRV